MIGRPRNNKTDVDWEKWGQSDPYFAVFTQEKYRNARLSVESRKDFFESGTEVVDHVLKICKSRFGYGFVPKRVLDFGCGVGRLLIPFSRISDQVVGLDVSESMLAEAKKNCEAYSVNNVLLVKSDDDLSLLNGEYDMIHSFVTFQHIPVIRGKRIFGKLLTHLSDGGVGTIQLTYAKSYFSETYGIPPVHSFGRKILNKGKSTLRRGVRVLRDLFKRKGPTFVRTGDPPMQMNSYCLNEVFFMLQGCGVNEVFVDFTDHGGHLGVYVVFRKPKAIG